MSLLTDDKLQELVLGSHYLSGESPQSHSVSERVIRIGRKK
jgi:hypothetical protein